MISITETDKPNIVAILLSFTLALILPLELFLFSYAFLGPLHYLTEINWLHGKSYFSRSRVFVLALILLILILSMGIGRGLAAVIIVLALGLSTLAVLESRRSKITSLAITIVILISVISLEPVSFLFAVLVPTIIHVSLFSIIFILDGSLKRDNGIPLSVPIYIVCIVLLLFAGSQSILSTDLTRHISQSGFLELSNWVAGIRGSDSIISGLRVLAFMYTFHYLNWFMKTKTIGWSHIQNNRRIPILVLWLASVLLYVYDYRLGLTVLFSLSIGHVLLEFPLNVRSIKSLLSHW